MKITTIIKDKISNSNLLHYLDINYENVFYDENKNTFVIKRSLVFSQVEKAFINNWMIDIEDKVECIVEDKTIKLRVK